MRVITLGIMMVIAMLNVSAVCAEELSWEEIEQREYRQEILPHVQKLIKKEGVYGLIDDVSVINTGAGAMIYRFRALSDTCYLLLDRTDFDNVMENEFRIKKEQVMGFNCVSE